MRWYNGAKPWLLTLGTLALLVGSLQMNAADGAILQAYCITALPIIWSRRWYLLHQAKRAIRERAEVERLAAGR
jgi:hypothetical protein